MTKRRPAHNKGRALAQLRLESTGGTEAYAKKHVPVQQQRTGELTQKSEWVD